MPAKHIVLANWTRIAWRRRGNARAIIARARGEVNQ
jgi:hypothetical protein